MSVDTEILISRGKFKGLSICELALKQYPCFTGLMQDEDYLLDEHPKMKDYLHEIHYLLNNYDVGQACHENCGNMGKNFFFVQSESGGYSYSTSQIYCDNCAQSSDNGKYFCLPIEHDTILRIGDRKGQSQMLQILNQFAGLTIPNYELDKKRAGRFIKSLELKINGNY